MQMKRSEELDSLRGISILAVVLFHYTTRYNQIYQHIEMPIHFPFGHLGVQLFYMISGYLILMSAENINNYQDFIVRRISKLFPSYWVSIIIIFSTIAIFSLPGREASFTDAILNLTMLQEFLGAKHVDGAFGVLSRFIAFYVFVAFVIAYNAKKRVLKILCIWMLLDIAIKLIMMSGVDISGKVRIILLVKEIGFFALGVTFYKIKHEGYSILCCLTFLLSLFIIFLTNGKLYLIAALIYSVIFYLIINNKGKFLKVKPLLWLGSISYSLYLIHQNIGYIIIRAMSNYNISFYLKIITPLVISIILATIITRYIEKPALKMIRNIKFGK